MDSKTKSEDFDDQEVSEEEPPSDATYGGSIDIWEPLEMVRRAFDIQICKGSVPPQVRTSTFEVLT